MTKRWTATKSGIQPKRLASKRRRKLAPDGMDEALEIKRFKATLDDNMRVFHDAVIAGSPGRFRKPPTE